MINAAISTDRIIAGGKIDNFLNPYNKENKEKCVYTWCVYALVIAVVKS